MPEALTSSICFLPYYLYDVATIAVRSFGIFSDDSAPRVTTRFTLYTPFHKPQREAAIGADDFVLLSLIVSFVGQNWGLSPSECPLFGFLFFGLFAGNAGCSGGHARIWSFQ